MYKLDLPVDYKEAAAIERRRQVEDERKTRIFNAKTRTIGVSVHLVIYQHREAKLDRNDNLLVLESGDANSCWLCSLHVTKDWIFISWFTTGWSTQAVYIIKIKISNQLTAI